jgi:Fe-S oxidoreductase
MEIERRYSYYVEERALSGSDRPRRFLEAFTAVLRHSNYGLALDSWARLAGRCSRCSVRCPLWLTTGEDRDQPCRRSELLLTVYRRYFTPAGRLRGRLPGAFQLTDDYLDRMAEEYYRCTACRRCLAACPIGVDHGQITHLARWLLAETDIIPKALLVAVRQQLEGIGNTSGIPVPALKDSFEFLEEDITDLYGAVGVRFPIDVEGAEYVFFPAVSDLLIEPDTLMGNAAVMHVTGASWTIGSGYFDAINYGLFYSDRMLERIVHRLIAETRRLRGRKILIGECGHATRSAWYTPAFGGPDAPPVVSCLEYTCRALQEGRIPLKGRVIEERVTYHDPCNISRSGRITEEPREILKAICRDYVEMSPTRTENFCCGGGGGTVSIDEIRTFRTTQMGRSKAAQIRETGASIVVAPCANCKKQLREVCEDNGLEGVTVVGVHDLLLRAIDFGVATPAPVAAEEGA